ncbi:MAG: DUF4173 domain-containing protein [Clostridiales Family XIII bacterium]|jgi:hypothetical protein|nr:DUF4173 domain-containing protein [Clostridiales Family XIII bacterium]
MNIYLQGNPAQAPYYGPGTPAQAYCPGTPAPAPVVRPLAYQKPGQPWVVGTAETLFACYALAMGFLFWEWVVGTAYADRREFFPTALGAFCFLVLAMAGTLVFLQARGRKQNRRSLFWGAVALAGAVPFLLYAGTPVRFFLMAFEALALLLWVMASCGTSISEKLSGFLLPDAINQGCIIPFANFIGLFRSFGKATDEKGQPVAAEGAGAEKRKGRGRLALAALLGVVAFIPVLIFILNLLMMADAAFDDVIRRLEIPDFLKEHFGMWVFNAVFGVPVACYLFGAVYGNARRRHTGHVTREGTVKTLSYFRGIPRAAILAPLCLLALVYLLFLAVMGGYLFSAFGGDLPAGFTYAEYARRGFFELCGVASINLALLAFVYLFAKRGAGEYPVALRVLTGLLSALTVLLVVTAMSKMVLYIDAYGLSRLRLYTFWFMALLLLVFAVLLVWHVRPFNAGRPIAVACVVCVLALFYVNTDGLIARYNVEQYLTGSLPTVDVEMLDGLSDAAVPYLDELAGSGKASADVREAAVAALSTDDEAYTRYSPSPTEGLHFYNWSVQGARAEEILQKYVK